MLDNIPSREEVEEAINEASELRDKIIDYRNSAQKYDDDFVEQHDEDAQEIHLDILPYGEELIRTSELPDALRKVIDNLNRGCPEFCVNGMGFNAEASCPRTGW
jgi:vacuolar-type H+-ATPase subunit H